MFLKNVKENWLGILGLFLLCVAIPISPGAVKNILNIAGFLALIFYAKAGNNALFFYFEIVVLVGYLLNILHCPNFVKFPLMIAVALAAGIKILALSEFRKVYVVFALIGLCGLVYGYLIYSNLGYAVGGIGMVIYSFIEFYRGVKVALIFGILNVVYSSIAVYFLV